MNRIFSAGLLPKAWCRAGAGLGTAPSPAVRNRSALPVRLYKTVRATARGGRDNAAFRRVDRGEGWSWLASAINMPCRQAFATLKCGSIWRKRRRAKHGAFGRFKSAARSGLHGGERIAVAVLGQRADVREAEMIAGDHALFSDD